uniref:WGS project CAEQ00000000 data, annotated contig 26 n=1 Tax=Trypanosoma congolense (strain IL3000) TaxID=1068625 RepID=F9WEG5_TRYCI|nr:unnamed protein product [Trypanosoma congolense IL3000]
MICETCCMEYVFYHARAIAPLFRCNMPSLPFLSAGCGEGAGKRSGVECRRAKGGKEKTNVIIMEVVGIALHRTEVEKKRPVCTFFSCKGKTGRSSPTICVLVIHFHFFALACPLHISPNHPRSNEPSLQSKHRAVTMASVAIITTTVMMVRPDMRFRRGK